MTSLAKPSNASVPLDGSWVNVGEGPLRLTLVSPNNAILVAANPTAPDGSFTGDCYVLIPGSNPVDFDDDVLVWAKAKGTPDQTKPISVLLQPLISAPVITSSETRQPGGSPEGTALTYTAGQSIGGAFVIPGALGNSAGLLRSILLKSSSVQTSEFDLYLFSQKPATVFADGAALPTLVPADVPLVLGVFKLTEVDSSLGVSVYQLNDINQMIVAPGGSIYAVLVPKGAATLSAASDISITLGIQQGSSGGL
jgi:hypothetical protein